MKNGKTANRERVYRARFIVAIIILGAAAAACEQLLTPTEQGVDTPARLILSPEHVTILPDDTVDFVAIGFTESGDTADVQVAWSASSGSISSNGVEGGRHLGWYTNGSCGEFRVTASSQPGDMSDTASVVVTCQAPGPVASVSVTPASATLRIAEGVQLDVELEDSNGVRLSDPEVVWTTSDAAIASVDDEGQVTGEGGGLATITATSQGVSGTSSITVIAASGGGGSTAPNFMVAFIGDQGARSDAIAVMQLIRDEGADMVLHQGDFDYSGDPDLWDDHITSVLGADFPYFASVGNHDIGRFYTSDGYQDKLQQRLDRVTGATCTGDLGVNSACEYQGLFFVLSGVGTLGSGHESYLRDQLAADNSTWRVCSWHRNMTALQLGSKDDDTGWGVYEACRELGAIIATAHEHSYHRTKTLVSTENQTVDPDWTDPAVLRVAPGATFVFVSGLGGYSIRGQKRCRPTTYPYGCNGEWASIYTSDQNAEYGALFIEFHVDGDPNKARGYFKNIDGQIVDAFTVTSQVNATSPANAVSQSQ